jgi:UDP-2-acetamido-3-amino-2,3-dideoxy-glucuronate N-acetyltransferase
MNGNFEKTSQTAELENEYSRPKQDLKSNFALVAERDPGSNPFVHPQAIVGDEVSLGKGTRVWAFAHIVSPASLGADCNICDHTFIEGDVRIGDRVTVKCGVSLWDGMTIENDVFIGPAAVFTNDQRPRSKKYPQQYPALVLKTGCTIGANSTTLPGLTIGCWAMVGAGAVVTRNVPDFALVMGNPARLCGWVCRCGETLTAGPGGRLACECGLTYEQVAENEVQQTNVESMNESR